MLTLLACVASLILAPLAAVKGLGYRGVYFGGAVLALFLGFFFLSMAVATTPPPATEAEVLGAELLDAVLPSLGGWLIVTAVACVIGACMFRRKAQARTADAARV